MVLAVVVNLEQSDDEKLVREKRRLKKGCRELQLLFLIFIERSKCNFGFKWISRKNIDELRKIIEAIKRKSKDKQKQHLD